MTGNWGLPTMPQVLSAIAYDTGVNPGFFVGDSLVISFNQKVFPIPVATKADLDNLFLWSDEEWTNYTGRWVLFIACADL